LTSAKEKSKFEVTSRRWKMTLVTGIGDEVVTVTVTFLVLLVVSIVWRSTRVRDRPQIVAATFTIHRDSTQTGDATSASQSETPVDQGGGGNEPAANEEIESDVDDADCVTIRIRFIDETQFEVRSPLTVTLGQFKTRHLRPTTNELSPIRANDRVRLIFNGKVLVSILYNFSLSLT